MADVLRLTTDFPYADEYERLLEIEGRLRNGDLVSWKKMSSILDIVRQAHDRENHCWAISERHPGPSYRISRDDGEGCWYLVEEMRGDSREAYSRFRKLRQEASAKAALLALAECELGPSDLLVTGSLGFRTSPSERAEIFRVVLRNIVGDMGMKFIGDSGGEDEQKNS